MTASLGYLAEAIHAHWKVRPVILIDENDYPSALRAEGVAEIEKIGLAYYRKRVEMEAKTDGDVRHS